MAARSQPSLQPPVPARRLGPGSPSVGRGAAVYAVSSETLDLADAAREGAMDKSDIAWRVEEGSGGLRRPEWAAPAQAPLLSAPMGSERLEGISVEEAKVTRTQLLEEELSTLKEELALCQVSRTLASGLSPPQRGRGRGRWGCAPLSLCLRLRSCAGLGPTRPRPPALPPGSHAHPDPLLCAGGTVAPGYPTSGSRPYLDTGRAEFTSAPRV